MLETQNRPLVEKKKKKVARREDLLHESMQVYYGKMDL